MLSPTQIRRNWREMHYFNQKGKCIYCGCNMVLVSGMPYKNLKNVATLEHLTARSRGGKDTIENTAASCHQCNTMKGSISHEDFLKVRSYDNWREVRTIMLKHNVQFTDKLVEHMEVLERIKQMPHPNAWKSRLGTYVHSNLWTHTDLDIALHHHAIKDAIAEVPYPERFRSILRKNKNKITYELLEDHMWYIIKSEWKRFIGSWKTMWTDPLLTVGSLF